VEKVFKKENRSIGKPRKRKLEDDESDPKKMGVKRLEIDLEKGQGLTWNFEPVKDNY
jgi:hypothetical protein